MIVLSALVLALVPGAEIAPVGADTLGLTQLDDASLDRLVGGFDWGKFFCGVGGGIGVGLAIASMTTPCTLGCAGASLAVDLVTLAFCL